MLLHTWQGEIMQQWGMKEAIPIWVPKSALEPAPYLSYICNNTIGIERFGDKESPELRVPGYWDQITRSYTHNILQNKGVN